MTAAIEAGTVLRDRYRLISEIGSGGMSAVWRGEDLSLTRPVAIKVLHDHRRSAVDHDRFQSEALASAKLHHPGIVAVYDTIRDNDVHAVVFEFVEGRTLRAELDAHGALDPDAAVDMACEIADALAVAHNQGIIHRDIKPSNIMLSSEGRAVVMDFGIAKDADQHDLTTENLFIGTPKYAAPEQVTGEPIDHRTDIYALSAVLYETLTGRAPFAGDTDVAMAMARLHDEPIPPSELNRRITAPLEAAVLRGMQRNPNDRPNSIHDLRNELRSAVTVDAHQQHPSHTPPFHRTERAWLVPTVFVIVTMIALTVAALLLRDTTTGRSLSRNVENLIGLAPEPPPTTEPSGVAPSFSAAAVTLASVATFDPFGTGTPGEHDELVPNATDQDPETVWRTETYNDRRFGTKPGVGLVLTLQERAALAQLVVASTSDDWSATVHVTDEEPANFEEWGPPVARVDGGSGTEIVALDSVSGEQVLLWITDLGVDAQFRLAEIDLIAVA